MVVLQMRNKQEQKEICYLQARNTKNKIQWWFCMCGISKSKKKCTIGRRGTSKIKYDDGFADAE